MIGQSMSHYRVIEKLGVSALKKLKLREVLSIEIQMAEGIKAAHDQGIVPTRVNLTVPTRELDYNFAKDTTCPLEVP